MKIGEDKVNAIVERITRAAQVISQECLEPVLTKGWLAEPIVKQVKERNQTCRLMTTGIYD